jgi:hypothetical protein
MSTASASNARAPRVTVGHVILGIAALHTLVGLMIGVGLDPSVPFEGSPPLTAMWNEGLVDSVGQNPWRVGLTWFLLWGFMLALVGLLAHQMERAGLALTRSFGAAFGALCVLGVALMPVSGFWLGLVPIGMILRRAPR